MNIGSVVYSSFPLFEGCILSFVVSENLSECHSVQISLLPGCTLGNLLEQILSEDMATGALFGSTKMFTLFTRSTYCFLCRGT